MSEMLHYDNYRFPNEDGTSDRQFYLALGGVRRLGVAFYNNHRPDTYSVLRFLVPIRRRQYRKEGMFLDVGPLTAEQRAFIKDKHTQRFRWRQHHQTGFRVGPYQLILNH